MHHPGHHQEPWQRVKIPFATAGSAATWLSALDPIYQPPQTSWAPPVLQASAASLRLHPILNSMAHSHLWSLFSCLNIAEMLVAEAAPMRHSK